MGAMFSTLFAKISAVVAWIGKLIVAVFVSLADLGKDLLSWLFEQVCKVAVSALSALDLSALTQAAQSAGSLPASIINILGLLGVGTAISIITAAILIRLALQLIPFVRLGS